MKQDRRGSWYLLTGVVLGIALGLFYSWALSPVVYVDAPPYALSASFKESYRALVAAAYLYNGDLLRASDRLAQLKDENVIQSLALQAQQAVAEGHPEEEVRALGILTAALAQQKLPAPSPHTPQPEATNISPTNGITPTTMGNIQAGYPTASSPSGLAKGNDLSRSELATIAHPASTVTSTPSNPASFVLAETTLVCNPDQPQPQLQVQVNDSSGVPVSSVEFMVTWDGGEDHFFTGLKPELGIGYADFLMTPEVIYSLNPVDGGQAIKDLMAAECLADDQDRYWGSWLLTFIQP